MRNRTTWIVTVAVLVLAAGLTTMPALSQEADTPTARQVVDRYIDAIGGEEAIRAHSMMAMEGAMEMVGQGMSAELKVRSMAPDKITSEVTLAGIGEIRSGYDGEVAWAVNPMTGPMILDGKELAQTRRQADFYSMFHGENLYKTMTNTGQADFEGKPCWKLELTTADGDVVTEYFNVETGLLEGLAMTQETPMGEITVSTVVADYKEFDGVMSPTKTTVKMGPGMEQVLTIRSIVYSGITEADFALPAEIQALVGGGEAPAAPEAPEAPENVNEEE